MTVSPEMVVAICTGFGTVVGSLSWIFGARLREKKIYRDNGFERRQNTITHTEHKQCLSNRENQEKTLFKNLDKIEACVHDNQKELKADIRQQSMETGHLLKAFHDEAIDYRKENREDFKTLFQKIDDLKR